MNYSISAMACILDSQNNCNAHLYTLATPYSAYSQTFLICTYGGTSVEITFTTQNLCLKERIRLLLKSKNQSKRFIAK